VVYRSENRKWEP